jgi:CP family cyanate transporter-like MFS transporter
MTAAAAPPPPDSRTDNHRWWLLTGVSFVYFSFGLVIGATAALVPAIREDLGLSRGEMGLVLGVWQLVYLGAAVPAGKLIDRFGLRFGLGAAAVVIFASGALRAAAQGLPSLLISVGLFGIGGPLVSIGAPKLVAVWFTDLERGKAVGMYGAAPPIGMTVALALSNGVVSPLVGDSWRATLVVFSSVALLAGAFWIVVAGREPDRAVAEDDSAPAMTTSALLRLPIVRVVLLLAVGGFLYSHSLSNWLVEILEDSGRSAASAGYWAAIPTFVGIFATLAVPRMATPSRRVPLFSATLLLGSLGALFLTSTVSVLLAPSLVAAGISRTTIMPLALLILMDHELIGSRNIAAAGGLFFTAGEIGGMSGPALTGWLGDISDGFGLPIAVLAIVMATMSALVWTLPAAARRSLPEPTAERATIT